MSYAALLLLIAALAVIGYWLGKYRARWRWWAAARASASLHSLPSYYGMLTALWCALPCLLVLVIWAGIPGRTSSPSLVRAHAAGQILASWMPPQSACS